MDGGCVCRGLSRSRNWLVDIEVLGLVRSRAAGAGTFKITGTKA